MFFIYNKYTGTPNAEYIERDFTMDQQKTNKIDKQIRAFRFSTSKIINNSDFSELQKTTLTDLCSTIDYTLNQIIKILE